MEEIVLQLQNYVTGAGILAPVVYVLVMILAIIVSPIPSSPLIIFAGVTFGWIKGFALSLLGMVTGAVIAFYVARILGRPIVEKLVSPKTLAKTKKMMPENKLTLAVFFLRILPLPFLDAVSYAAGLTQMCFRHFFMATVFGLIPLVFTLSYFSEDIKDPISLIVIALSTIIILEI